MKATVRLKGGPGSGNHGHAGRPGQVGGSASTYDNDRMWDADMLVEEMSYNLDNSKLLDNVSSYQSDTGLSIYPEDAIHVYRGKGYLYINRHLRGQDLPADTPERYRDPKALDYIVGIMDSQVKETALPKSVVVYRGLYDKDMETAMASNPDSLIGREFTDKGYVSTSLVESSARSIGLAQSINQNSEGIVFRMVLPKGLNVLPGNPTEQEIILPRGQTFRITSVDPYWKRIGIERIA